MNLRSLYVVQVLDCGASNPFRIVERISTIDGLRDRITMTSFATLEEARVYTAQWEAPETIKQ